MIRAPLTIAFVVAMSCAAFAQAPNPQAPNPTEAATLVVGSPVYSSDAQEVGQVTGVDMGTNGKITGLQAEISGFLGLGSSSVHLGSNEFKQNGNRIVLSKTADQVRGLPSESYHPLDRSGAVSAPAASP